MEDLEPSLNFGEALELAKQGKRIARHGWNGKGMWVAMVPAQGGHGATEVLGTRDQRAHLVMRTVDNEIVPWTISQTDALAEDWGVRS